MAFWTYFADFGASGMMRTQELLMKARRNPLFAYTLCFFVFLLTGFFQAVDVYLPEFFHALFALLTHALLISLVLFWGFSLWRRIVRKDLRAFLIAVASLLLFWFLARMVKYGMTQEKDTLSCYLWYSYYVPQCFIPPTLFLCALNIEKKNGKALPWPWYLIYLPALVLVVLVFTNDLHQWVFLLRFENGEFHYTHRIVFYLALAWEIGVSLASLLVLILKCRVFASKRKGWIPCVVFLLCVAFSSLCFFFNSSAFKVPELLSFTGIALIESCIFIGLIPSNRDYETFFVLSDCPAFIVDKGFHLVLSANPSEAPEKDQMEKAVTSSLILEDGFRLSGRKIHGGYAFLKEDARTIQRLNAELEEVRSRLQEENDLSEAENEMKAKKAKVEEGQKIYREIEEESREMLASLKESLLQAERAIDSEKYEIQMARCCVLGVCIKRRSNLLLLAKKDSGIPAEELRLSFSEILGFLPLLGIESSLDFEGKGSLSKGECFAFFDFFRSVCLSLAPSSSVLIRFAANVLSFQCDGLIQKAVGKLKKEFPTITVRESEEAVYLELALGKEGRHELP